MRKFINSDSLLGAVKVETNLLKDINNERVRAVKQSNRIRSLILTILSFFALTYTVNALVPAYYITLSPTSLNFSASGGTQTITVSTNIPSGCLMLGYSGCISSATISGNTITVNVNSNSTNYLQSGSVTLSEDCGYGKSASVSVYQDYGPVPEAAGAIGGNASVCEGGSGYYYISPITGATQYNWSIPAGATITSGSGTTSIYVSYPTGSTSGSVSVYGSNSYGNGQSSSFPVTVNVVPGNAGPITGSTSVCIDHTSNFSVAPITGATGYSWAVPPGASIVSGNNTNSVNVSFPEGSMSSSVAVLGTSDCGTGSGSGLYVNVFSLPGTLGAITGNTTACPGGTAYYYVSANSNVTDYVWSLPSGATITSGNGTSLINVSFSSGVVAGSVSVYGHNICGNGPSTSLPIVVGGVPGAAGTISGSASVCIDQPYTYSIAPVPNATGYYWSVPSGASITSGSNANSISVNYPAGCSSGSIVVFGQSPCGNGTGKSLFVTVNSSPAAAGTITGQSSVTQGQTGITYSVPSISGATGYVWSVPSGATITSGSPSSSITVSYSASASSGSVSVYGTNSCGSGTPASKAVTINSPPPPTTANAGADQTDTSTCGLTSVTLAANSPTVGTGLWSIINGSGGSIASPSSPTSTFSGIAGNTYTLRWTISNAPSTPSIDEMSVTFNTAPGSVGTITGSQSVYSGQTSVSYSVPAITNATSYSWNYTGSGATIYNSSTKDVTITFASNATSGTLYVKGVNGSCNGSTSPGFNITIGSLPDAAGTITGSGTVTKGQSSVAYSVPSINNATSYVWTYSGTGATFSNGTSNSVAISFASNATSGNLTVIGTNSFGNGTVSPGFSITVNAAVAQIVPPASLLINGTALTLTVRNGNYGTSGSWRFFDGFKDINSFTSASDVYNLSAAPIRSTRYRVRAENSSNGFQKSYFVSAKYHVNETLTPNSLQNYIVSYSPNDPVLDESSLNNLLLEDQGAVVQYFDGLGRPTQNVAANQSYYFNDLVTGVSYDDFGRENKKYIPSTNHGRGYGVSDLTTNINSFYSGTVGNAIDGIAPLPVNATQFTLTQYEPSPLNRVTSVVDPKGGTTVYSYNTNSANDVIIWSVDAAHNCVKGGTYPAAELYMTQTSDPVGNTVIEYKDKQGQVVLKIAGTARTYYVYDDFGLLRYVLSPKASESMSGTTPTSYSNSDPIVKGLCYYYQYDHRKRMILKQLPGADKVLMLYDARDRLVLMQDGKTRAENASKWLYTKYENNQNRPVETGWLITSNTLETITSDFAAGVDFPVGYTSSDILTRTFYDTYQGSPIGGLTVNQNVKGMVTRTTAKQLDGSGDVTTDMFYDDKYRVIQTNVQGGPIGQVTTNTYDFVGKLLSSTEVYSGAVTQSITKTFTYDHAGRLEKVEQQIAGDTTNGNVVLAQNDYNELGELMLKKLHSAGETSFVQDIDYLYDVQGWLSSINDPANPSQSKLYGEQLNYFANGNIQNLSWKNTLLDAQNAVVATNKQKYVFSYDALNRITGGTYSETDASNATVNANNFDESYAYDANGNIATLDRKGNMSAYGNTPVYDLIDNLTYNYTSGTNQLSSVSDAITSGVAHDLEYKPSAGSYAYDANGSATYVPERSVSVAYNYLNLPSAVTVGSQGTISYLYDASGAKLKKTVGSVISYYQGSVLKLNGVDIIMTGEGRAIKNGTWSYEYDLKDHLGNTRVSFAAGNGTALPKQYKDYYPFGLEMARWYTNDASATKYLYNGKELQDEFGLGWYDYGARFYDPIIGRWMVIDNKAEKFSSITPYAYAVNNPIIFLDPNGNDIVYFNMKGEEVSRTNSTTEFRTYVGSTGNYSEASMPKIISGYESAIYQKYDYNIAAQTFIFNNLSADQRPTKSLTGDLPPDLDPTLVKAMIIEETGAGTIDGEQGQKGKSDIMQANVTTTSGQTDWNDNKKSFGLEKDKSATPNQSIYAGIRILCTKGLLTTAIKDKNGKVTGYSVTWRGSDWNSAVKRYNGGGNANYLEDVLNYLNNAMDPTTENYNDPEKKKK